MRDTALRDAGPLHAPASAHPGFWVVPRVSKPAVQALCLAAGGSATTTEGGSSMNAQQQTVQEQVGQVVSTRLLPQDIELARSYRRGPATILHVAKLMRGMTAQQARENADNSIERARAISQNADVPMAREEMVAIRTLSAAFSMWMDIAEALEADEVQQ